MLLQPDLQPGLPASPRYSKKTCLGRWAVCNADADDGCQRSCVIKMMHCFMPCMGLMDMHECLPNRRATFSGVCRYPWSAGILRVLL